MLALQRALAGVSRLVEGDGAPSTGVDFAQADVIAIAPAPSAATNDLCFMPLFLLK
jgi:hypothetical protein